MYHTISKLGQILVEALTETIRTMALVYWLVALPLLVGITASLVWPFFSQYKLRPRRRSFEYANGRLFLARPRQATISSERRAFFTSWRQGSVSYRGKKLVDGEG